MSQSAHTSLEFFQNLPNFSTEKQDFLNQMLNTLSNKNIPINRAIHMCKIAIQIEDVYLKSLNSYKESLTLAPDDQTHVLSFTLEDIFEDINVTPTNPMKASDDDLEFVLDILFEIHNKEERYSRVFYIPLILTQSPHNNIHKIIVRIPNIYNINSININMTPIKPSL
jgi:hypothetical protein